MASVVGVEMGVGRAVRFWIHFKGRMAGFVGGLNVGRRGGKESECLLSNRKEGGARTEARTGLGGNRSMGRLWGIIQWR